MSFALVIDEFDITTIMCEPLVLSTNMCRVHLTIEHNTSRLLPSSITLHRVPPMMNDRPGDTLR